MRNLNTRIQTHLSKREIEIVHLIAAEFSTKEIADQLYLSAETVKTHRKRIQAKLNVKNVAGIVRASFQLGILSLDFSYSIAS